jgi:hypothetical protein
MIDGYKLGRLIELAFDYVSAETEQQANQIYNQAVKLTTETSMQDTIWLDLVDHIRECNSSNGNNYPLSWTSALHFFSTGRAELELHPNNR